MNEVSTVSDHLKPIVEDEVRVTGWDRSEYAATR